MYNLKSGKTKAIQVKGSVMYKPQLFEIEKVGYDGQTSFFLIDKNKISNLENKLDFFIFVLYWTHKSGKYMKTDPQFLIIPLNELQTMTSDKKLGKKINMVLFFS